MKTQYIVMGLSALIAIFIIFQKEKSLFDDNNEDFRHGLVAGVFLPGPLTILVFFGLVASHI
jgi:hypothetical protein